PMAHGTKLVIYAALVGNSLIAVTKFIAAAITGSAAMMAEGIHSLVDTGNQVLLLHGMRRATKPADDRFPFGHGKEIYFWSFVVAIMVFALGSGVSIYEGVHRVLHPEIVTDPIVNYIVLALAFAFESVAWWMAWREFRGQRRGRGIAETVQTSKDPTTFVVLFEDSAALLGLLVAAVGLALSQILEMPIFDGIASIGIGLILAFTAIWLAMRTKSLLIGEAAEPALVADVTRRAGALPAVVAVNEVLTLHMGPDYVLLNISVDFADDLPAGDIEMAIEALTRDIRTAHPRIQRVFVEAESRLTENPDQSA
ncbi:MAG: cation diffusion facilitator family transporter, partial [Phycisphaerales bacterium]|nr:cation diffusion facilitator family transporter [Phycisphaerales bacterium]